MLQAITRLKWRTKQIENGRWDFKEVDKTLHEIGSAEKSMQVSSQKVTDLHKESMNIGAILEVTKSVSSKLTPLALNAAIEAARAGEQGRFAVVADEVRMLAKRTQDSASQIDEPITSLQRGARCLSIVEPQHGFRCFNSGTTSFRTCMWLTKHIQDLNQANSQIAVSVDEQD